MLVSIGTETVKSIDILPLFFIKSWKKKEKKNVDLMIGADTNVQTSN